MARTKKTDTATTPLFLLVTEERSAGFGCGSDQYFHLHARIVTDRWENGTRFPYGVSDTYDGPLYSGLRATCQGDDKSRQREGLEGAVYGIDVEYNHTGRIQLNEARRMIKMLERISKGMEKFSDKRGYVRTFGDYAGRLAEIFGCAGIIIEKSAAARDRTGERYRWMDIGTGVNAVNNAIYQWQQEAKAKEDAA